MNVTLLASIITFLGSGGIGWLCKWLIDRKIAEVTVKQHEASLADQIGTSATNWIHQQDERVATLTRDLDAARKETAVLREEVAKLSQELNAFRLGISAPLGYVIVPRVVWEQARQRDLTRRELPSTAFPGEDINDIVQSIKDPGEGGGV